MSLFELCQEIKNFFVQPDKDIHTGTFTISGGQISDVDFLLDGQYFRIVGSVLNDGVYKHPASSLESEEFTGAVWAMRVPPAIIALAAEIDAWVEANTAALSSPYQSESFGGYSYTLKSGGASSGTSGVTWQSQFANRLNKWRRLSVL